VIKIRQFAAIDFHFLQLSDNPNINEMKDRTLNSKNNTKVTMMNSNFLKSKKKI